MKKRIAILGLAALLLCPQAFAADSGHAGHGAAPAASTAPAAHDMAGMDHKAMGHAAAMGASIHEATVDGYKLAYHLSSNAERMEAAKKAGTLSAADAAKAKSHHLMIYIANPAGAKVTDAKVGFLVKGPDGKEQTVMGMFMEGGFSADVDLKAPGAYTIKSKSTVGGKNVLDQFTYTTR